MSESILNALIQLFALTATTSKVTAKGRKIVDAFLRQHLSRRLIDEYVDLFDSYLSFYKRDMPEINEHTEANYGVLIDYVDKVCIQIRKGLQQADRILVFIRMLEYVCQDDKVTEVEREIVDTVASCFSIDPKEAHNLKNFLFRNDFVEIDTKSLLLIEDQPRMQEEMLEGLWVEQHRSSWDDDSNIIHNEKIGGRLGFLLLPSIGAYVLRYFGKSELYLDGKIIIPGKAYIFEVGSIVRGAEVEPIYFGDVSKELNRFKAQQRIVFTADNLEFSFRNSSNGIKNFSFSEESGQLIGIMGGSGVGKSTLLNLLTGKSKPKKGTVTVNGYNIHTDKRATEGIIGYVPQDDLLFEDLTVYQNLYYNAKLCFSNFTEFKIRQTVKRVLDNLDLWEIRDLKVGSPLNKMISGGQRKRLNIGLELLREPGILFVDEPTSGLSSSDSLMVMRLLKQQAENGRLVIVNIHQPSSKIFKLFDKLWVLDKGGYPIYAGHPVDAIVYFKTMSTQVNASESGCSQCGSINPEQVLEIVEARVVDEQGKLTAERLKKPWEWNRLYQQHIQSKVGPKEHKGILPKNFFNIPNVEVQFKIFTIRNFLSKIANKQYVFINLMEAPVLAFILAFFTKYIPGNEYLFSENKNLPAFLFMSIVVSLFMGLMGSAEEIINDRKILERESFLNLSRFSYLNAKVFYLFLLSGLQMLMFVLIGNYILEIEGMTISFWLILFTVSCFANMIGLNISSGLNSVVAIYIVIPFILVPQILLSGTIVQFDNLHPSLTKKVYTPFVGDLMASRWAYEALAVEAFKNNNFEKHFYHQEQKMSQAHFKISFLIPRLQSKLEECVRLFNREEQANPRMERNLAVVRNELIRMQQESQQPPFEYLSQLNPNDFLPNIADEANGYLIFLKLHYSEQSNKASHSKDSIYQHLVDSLGGDKVFDLKQKNHNKALADWVQNTNEISKMLETDGQIVQKFDPIFMYPNHPWGRAQFYAPVKYFNGQYVDTLWFNLAVIWLGSLALFVALQIDLLRKGINYFESLRLYRKALKSEKTEGIPQN